MLRNAICCLTGTDSLMSASLEIFWKSSSI